MQNFRYQCEIEKAEADVYAALTTQQGIRGWWTPDCDVDSEQGGLVKVRFGKMFHTYKTELLLPGKEVHWLCTEHFHDLPGLNEFHEWIGTRLHFRLTAVGSHTMLKFEHEGLTPELDCYKHCSERWPFFLGISLKGHVESHAGQPYTDGEPSQFKT